MNQRNAVFNLNPFLQTAPVCNALPPHHHVIYSTSSAMLDTVVTATCEDGFKTIDNKTEVTIACVSVTTFACIGASTNTLACWNSTAPTCNTRE